jgi:hypothetical protein
MKKALLNSYVVTVFGLLVLLQGCASSNSKELTRDSAKRLIEADKSFNQPHTIRLENSQKFPVPAESMDEPPPDARAVELFYRDYPLTAALHRLGLVEAEATMVEKPQALAFGHLTMWKYKVEARLTSKGKELTNGATDELPLYRKQVIEVTGVTAGQSGSAQAEFKWRRVPTPLGEALEIEGPTFQSLPPEIQKGLKGSISRFGNALPKSYKLTNSGQAEFRLFDDGWRVDNIRL